MNIHDFKAAPFTPNWLRDIFEKQQKLLWDYQEIEGMPELPVSIHTHTGQKWIKDFLWRVTEELGESFEASILRRGVTNFEESTMHDQHQIEELIDALHFIVELIILVGKDWEWAREQLDMNEEQLEVGATDPERAYWQVTYYMCMVGNTLKNKPWKKTEMQTDESKFYLNLGKAFRSLFACLNHLKMGEEEVFSYYDRKNQVNQFRQKSNY